MPEGKVNVRKVLRLIDGGYSQAEIARREGVSRQAIHRIVKQARGRKTKIIVAKEYDESIQRGFDAMRQLTEINEKSLGLLDQAEKAEDRELMLKCIGEVRNQIKLAADIQLSMFGLEEALRFMTIVKEALREASPDAYQEFKRLINNEPFIGSALRFS